MNNIRIICALALALAGAGAFGDTFRDAMGRNRGTATTDRYGKTTYRDSMGRTQGSSTTDRYGKTTYRDAMGRSQGSSSTDRTRLTAVCRTICKNCPGPARNAVSGRRFTCPRVRRKWRLSS